MNLTINFKLTNDDKQSEVFEQDDIIKVFLQSGEVIIGRLMSADYSSLTIQRDYNCADEEYDFCEINSIEKIIN